MLEFPLKIDAASVFKYSELNLEFGLNPVFVIANWIIILIIIVMIVTLQVHSSSWGTLFTRAILSLLVLNCLVHVLPSFLDDINWILLLNSAWVYTLAVWQNTLLCNLKRLPRWVVDETVSNTSVVARLDLLRLLQFRLFLQKSLHLILIDVSGVILKEITVFFLAARARIMSFTCEQSHRWCFNRSLFRFLIRIRGSCSSCCFGCFDDLFNNIARAWRLFVCWTWLAWR